MDDDLNLDIDLEGVPVVASTPRLTAEEKEMVRGIFDDEDDPQAPNETDTAARAVEPIRGGKDDHRDHGGPLPDAEAAENEADPGNDFTLDDLMGDTLPAVPEVFPEWRTLFRRRPFIQLRPLEDGRRVLVVGYAFQEGADGTLKLDNAKVGDVVFTGLVSICAPFSRSNETDSKGVKIKVIEAVEGTKVRCWTNLRESGTRRDLNNATFTVTKEGLVPSR